MCGHLHYTEEDHDSNVGKEAKQLRPLGCFEVKARQETIEIHRDRTQARVCASRLATDLYPQFVARKGFLVARWISQENMRFGKSKPEWTKRVHPL